MFYGRAALSLAAAYALQEMMRLGSYFSCLWMAPTLSPREAIELIDNQ